MSVTSYMMFITIKGNFRPAEKSRKVLMMMKATKLGWAGPGAGQKQGRSRPGAKQEQGGSMSRAGAGQEQGRNRAGAELSRAEQS